jgi:hypothetical protein
MYFPALDRNVFFSCSLKEMMSFFPAIGEKIWPFLSSDRNYDNFNCHLAEMVVSGINYGLFLLSG